MGQPGPDHRCVEVRREGGLVTDGQPEQERPGIGRQPCAGFPEGAPDPRCGPRDRSRRRSDVHRTQHAQGQGLGFRGERLRGPTRQRDPRSVVQVLHLVATENGRNPHRVGTTADNNGAQTRRNRPARRHRAAAVTGGGVDARVAGDGGLSPHGGPLLGSVRKERWMQPRDLGSPRGDSDSQPAGADQDHDRAHLPRVGPGAGLGQAERRPAVRRPAAASRPPRA